MNFMLATEFLFIASCGLLVAWTYATHMAIFVFFLSFRHYQQNHFKHNSMDLFLRRNILYIEPFTLSYLSTYNFNKKAFSSACTF